MNGGMKFRDDPVVALAEELITALSKRDIQVQAALADYLEAEGGKDHESAAARLIFITATCDKAYDIKVREISTRFVDAYGDEFMSKIQSLGFE